MIRPVWIGSTAIRSKARSSWLSLVLMSSALPRGDDVEQRVGDVEHRLERRDAHALGRLVVALGAVGEADGVEALDLEGVAVGGAAGDDLARRVAAGLQGALGGRDR